MVAWSNCFLKMEAPTSSINVAIVDDQNLFRDAIAFRINNLDNYRVSFQASK